MSAVEEYKAVRHDINHGGFPPFSGEQMSRIRGAADAAVAELEAERDKWEWVARDACRELAYETHVNPQSPLDYRLAHLPPLPSPPGGYIRGYSHDCKGEIHGDDSSVPYPAGGEVKKAR